MRKRRLKGFFCLLICSSLMLSSTSVYAEDIGVGDDWELGGDLTVKDEAESRDYDVELNGGLLYNKYGDVVDMDEITKGTRIKGDVVSGGLFKVFINGVEVTEYPENLVPSYTDGIEYVEGYTDYYTVGDPPTGYNDDSRVSLVPNPEYVSNSWGGSIEYYYNFLFLNYNLGSYDLMYHPGFGSGDDKWVRGIRHEIDLYDGSDYTRGGYKLVGWSTYKENEYEDPEYTLGQSGVSNLAVDGGTAVLFANWKHYEVMYDVNGGTDSGRTYNAYMTDSNELTLYDPTSDYTASSGSNLKFGGWKLDKDGTSADFQANEIITPDDFPSDAYQMTLYAHWEKIADNYTIQYDSNDGGSSTFTQVAKVGQDVKLNSGVSLNREGYTFIGWSTSKDGSTGILKPNEYVSSLTTKKDDTVTLYAQWEQNKYTIQYDYNDGSSNSFTQTATVGQDVKLDLGDNLARDDYEFIGWSTSKDGSTGIYKPSEVVSSLTSVKDANVILYAQWKNKTYTINYNSNIGGTSDTVSKVVNRDEDIHLLGESTFTKEGYVIKEWNTSPDGKGTSYQLGGIVRDLVKSGGTIDLYAQWEGIVQVPPSVDNGTQTPPSVDNGTQVPPSVDNGTQTPPSNGSGSNTGSGGDANSGVSGDNNGSDNNGSSSESNQTPPSSGGNQTPPSSESNQTPPSSESNQTPPSSGGNNQTVPDNDVEDDESDSNIFEINLEFTGSDITLEEVGTDKDYTVSLEGTEIIGGADYKEENGKIVLDKTLFIGKDTGSYIIEVVQGSDKYIYRIRVNVPSLKIRKLMGRNDFFKLKTLNTTDVKSISWKSNNTSLCTVDENGWVKTKNKTGITSVECDIVTRTGYRYKFICKIDIRPRIKVTHNYSSARIKDKSNVNVMLDKELHIGVPVNIIYNNLSKDAQIKYYTSDSSIARVTKDGKLEGLKKGKCNVKVVVTQNKFKYVYYFNAVVVK